MVLYYLHYLTMIPITRREWNAQRYRRVFQGKVRDTMLLYVFGVVLWGFVCFVIVSEQWNPFSKPDNFGKLSRWKQGMKFAGGAFTSGALLVLIAPPI